MTWPQAKIEALRLVEEIAARHGELARCRVYRNADDSISKHAYQENIMARLTRQEFDERIKHALYHASLPISRRALFIQNHYLNIAARLLVKQYISARRERESRKVQQCYDAVGA
jgi:hypothetical protein